jgi:hypothetical protein
MIVDDLDALQQFVCGILASQILAVKIVKSLGIIQRPPMSLVHFFLPEFG